MAMPRPDTLSLIDALRSLGALPDRDDDDPLDRVMQIMAEGGQPAAPLVPHNALPGRHSALTKKLREEHFEMVALALGACPLCWGRDVACIRCTGRGKPGRFQPDAACFACYVLPAIDRVLEEHRKCRQQKCGREGGDFRSRGQEEDTE